MEDKYLKLKWLDDDDDDYLNKFIKLLPKKSGILYSIEYPNYICYGISTANRGMKYHRLDGAAILYKKEYNKPDEYWVYSKLIGYTNNTTFEEFKIKRDKILKEITFQ